MQLVADDLVTLAEFLPKFFERASESEAQRQRREWRRLADPEGAARHDRERATEIPAAVEMWIAHLADLDLMSEGVQFTLADLAPEEVRGLALFRRERQRFLNEHEGCPCCKSMNPVGSKTCWTCGAGR